MSYLVITTLRRYESGEPNLSEDNLTGKVEAKNVDEVLLDSVDALMFELDHMVRGTPLGRGLALDFCAAFGKGLVKECLAQVGNSTE